MKKGFNFLQKQLTKGVSTVLMFIIPLQACNVNDTSSHEMNNSSKYELKDEPSSGNIQPEVTRLSKPTATKKQSNVHTKTIIITAIITLLLTFGITFGVTYGVMKNELNSCASLSSPVTGKTICSNAVIDAMASLPGSDPSVLLDPTINCWEGQLINVVYSSSAGQAVPGSIEMVPDTTKTTEYIVLQKN